MGLGDRPFGNPSLSVTLSVRLPELPSPLTPQSGRGAIALPQ